MNDQTDPKTEIIAETENNIAYKTEEGDGETTYNLQINNVTLHFFAEEWDEFIDLVRALVKEN